MDLREKQLQYELETDHTAAVERLEELRASVAAGDVELPRTARFIARAFGEVRERIVLFQNEASRGTAARFKGWLRAVPADIAAVIALRVTIEQCTSTVTPIATFQSIARGIGSMYHLEAKIAQAAAVNGMYMDKVTAQITERGTTASEHIRKVYNFACSQVMRGEDESLSVAELVQLGRFGLQAVMDAGIVEMHRAYSAKGDLVQYVLAPEVSEFLTKYSEDDVAYVVNSSSSAMMCPPDPWTELGDGGYLSARRKATLPLMPTHGLRRSERGRIRREFTAEAMPRVFQVANYLQSTPLSVHEPTLAAVRALWEQGGGALGVPTKQQPRKTPFPYGEDWSSKIAPEDERDVVRAWKRQVVRDYDTIRVWRGKTRELSGFLSKAVQSHDRFWLPVFVDSRGRWYYRGAPNPQGSDIARACLHFADRKPLGPRGLFWLKVHLANSLGFDGVRMQQRAEWVDLHWQTIQEALDEPLAHRDVWEQDDKPWVAYSAAWELREAYRSGNPETYCTGVPVHMDATCSGLQHFSALLRDPVGGAYVNLLDGGGEAKQDVYRRVADLSWASIQRDLTSTDLDTVLLARYWTQALGEGIPRSWAKKPVMTYVYGATLFGTATHLEGLLIEGGIPAPTDSRPIDATMYLARKLFSGIANAVPAAAFAMRWLQQVAKDTPAGKRMEWTSPTGFRVQHDYQSYTDKRVHVRSCGVVAVLVRDYGEGTIRNRMENAIAPNFVHALDASHLALTAERMQSAGLQMLGIHDSFGTHPGSVDYMQKAIRESFVSMYTHGDICNSFLWEVGGLGETPPRGTLDLSAVLTSEFFFS